MPRNFACPATDSQCIEEQCNYKATGYCLRGEREDFAVRRAQAEKARKRQEDEARSAEAKRLRERRKELRIELLRKRIGHLTF